MQEAWCGRSIRREDCAVAAGKECGFYLGRGRGLCEGFKQGMTGSTTFILERPERLQVGAVGLEDFEWRLEGSLGGFS